MTLAYQLNYTFGFVCWFAWFECFALFATIFIYWIEELKTKINLLSFIFVVYLCSNRTRYLFFFRNVCVLTERFELVGRFVSILKYVKHKWINRPCSFCCVCVLHICIIYRASNSIWSEFVGRWRLAHTITQRSQFVLCFFLSITISINYLLCACVENCRALTQMNSVWTN